MEPTLASMEGLDRAVERRSDIAFLAAALRAPGTRFAIFVEGRAAILSNPERTWTTVRWLSREELDPYALAAACDIAQSAIFLGLTAAAGEARFAVCLADDAAGSVAVALKPMVDILSLATQGVMSPDELSVLGLARALGVWHSSHRYCGQCGARSISSEGGWRRDCAACGTAQFPRTDPVVIMLVSDDTHCVLARQPGFPEGMYSLPAGFVEPGEDIEHAVRREAGEEVGLEVKRVAYALSQPWPFPHSLMIGCLAEATHKALRLEAGEIEDARWFSSEEVHAMVARRHPQGLWVPGPQAIAHALIRRWLSGLGP